VSKLADVSKADLAEPILDTADVFRADPGPLAEDFLGPSLILTQRADSCSKSLE
jgi:hypothetical protein